jgi:hypothetical protein
MKLEKIVEAFPNFYRSKLIKIDTDGMDCSIIESSTGYLIENHLIIFFEYDPFYFVNNVS